MSIWCRRRYAVEVSPYRVLELEPYLVRAQNTGHKAAAQVMAAHLPESLIDFIHECIPTYQAAELLLFFASHPDGDFSVEDIVVAMRPAVITVPAVKEYTLLFVDKGLITQAHGHYRYGPSTEHLERGIGELAHAYNERPVTLIRAIYRIADSKIQSFADSFKLRED